MDDSRQPIQTKRGTIWVSNEIAQKIASGEINPDKAPSEKTRQVGQEFLRQLMAKPQRR